MNISNENRFAVSISQAGDMLEQICRTYLEKTPDGEYMIPVNRQRPVMLMGPSGIGKTDIPRQTAEKLGIGFVSYSITHHTRQSALGLPKIVSRNYGGNETLTTEYTASEIITAVNDAVENEKKTSGILFIDEINCASETLSAPLLQLFQNKTLGSSVIPDGWILVMAGNPSEYNKSVKEFDAVTRDRLRIINVVPDGRAWLEYAERKGLNETVVSYIASDENNIYRFDSASCGIVTPRGWEELAINIEAYRRNGFEVTGELVSQFIGDPSSAVDFYDYYKLVTETVSEREINMIVEGKLGAAELKKLVSCRGNIRYVLIACLRRRLKAASENIAEADRMMDNIVNFIKEAYGANGEFEIFMSSILSDPEIVKMTVRSHNKYFKEYLNSVVNTENDIRKRIKESKKGA